MKRVPATPEEIDSRIRRVALLMEAKWEIFDQMKVVRKPASERVDSTNAPMPGFPIRKPETE